MHNHSSSTDFRFIFESIPGNYLVLSPELKIIAASDEFLLLTTSSHEKITGKRIFDVFPFTPDGPAYMDTTTLQASLDNVLKNKIVDRMPVQRCDIRSPASAGNSVEERYLGAVNSPVFGENQQITYILHRVEDRTGIEQTKKELANSHAELARFTYVASHDLQEPLRTITSYIQLIKNRYQDKLDPDANDFIEHIVDGSKRMRNLIYSLLEYSRVNRIKPFERINCNELLDDVLQNLTPRILENNATIVNEELPVIEGDPVLMSELFQKLIANSIKFKSDKTLEIKISAKKTGNQYVFAVEDNGIGFEQKYADKIFEIFQRLHTREKYEGTGMGLAICKKIAERHSGKIWAESQAGKGSSFYFSIPIVFKNNPSVYETS